MLRAGAEMRLETLERLIESADFSDFRIIAARYLELRGFLLPEITDGWSDGGRDIRVHQLPPNPSPVAIQTSVERRWKSKIKEDALKAKERLSVNQVLYVTSRRIPEAEFATIADSLWREHAITLQKADSQSLASTFSERDKLLELLDLLGIPVELDSSAITSKPKLSEDTAYAYIFFGGDATDFRSSVIERGVISAVCYNPNRSRDALTDVVVTSLGLGDAQRHTVSSAIDRLMQSRELLRTTTGYEPSAKEYERYRAALAIKELHATQLATAVRKVLAERGVADKALEVTADAILQDLASLIMLTATSLARTAERPAEWHVFRSEMEDRLRHLHATLSAAGLNPAQVEHVRGGLTEVCMSSPLARHLVAGELFVHLSGVDTPRLVQALGARDSVRVLFDANVVMPVLAGMMYEPGQQRYFRAADRAYHQARAHGMNILVPRDYLEETASHLVHARDRYAAIVGKERDLEFSTNAFVAHYAYLARIGRAPTFTRYLASFGLTPELTNAGFRTSRDIVMQRLRGILDRYALVSRPLGVPSTPSMRRAERALAFAARKLGQDRPRRLMEHDARTLGYLLDVEGSADEALLFVTWDRLHSYVGSEEALGWSILNPAAATDLLAMARGSSDEQGWMSPVWIAMALSDSDAELGAQVLDKLVELEQANLYDADLLTMAREFKASYVDASHGMAPLTDVEVGWAEWKARHE